jgi:hypothetical protein
MSILMIGNQYQMTATIYGVLISVSAPTLEGVKSQFEHELYMLELSIDLEDAA